MVQIATKKQMNNEPSAPVLGMTIQILVLYKDKSPVQSYKLSAPSKMLNKIPDNHDKVSH